MRTVHNHSKVWGQWDVFERVSYSQQCCISLIKNTEKIEILL